jgi:glucokinase
MKDRKRKVFFMSDVFPVLGFDVGGTKIAVCVGDSSGTMLRSARIENRDREPEDVLNDMAETGFRLLDEAGIAPELLRAVGIGSPAPMDVPNGLILGPPNMKKWKCVPIRDSLAAAFRKPVHFDNDANAGALAEWFFGAGRNCENMVYLTMSTGIGGGIIANGRLVRGKSFTAGEVGHIVIDVAGPVCNCGLKGCYEAFCGGRAIAQRMRQELAERPEHPIVRHAGSLEAIDMIALEKAVREQDPYAVALWDEMCMRNAQAIGGIINTLNPERIVLGTLAWATGDLFMVPFRKKLPAFCWPDMLAACEIAVSGLGRSIGEFSGIAVALNAMYESGEWKRPRE